jgi:hypothetical protein
MMDGASHFVQYERGRHAVHRLTEEWLKNGRIAGATHGEFATDWDGKIRRLD